MRETSFEPTFESQPDNQAGQERELGQRERLQFAVLAGLARNGALTEQSGRRVFDVEKLKNWSSKNEINAVGRKATQFDVVRVLSSIKGVAKSENENSLAEEVETRPVMVTPKSLEDLVVAGQEGYGDRSKTALLQPWEFGQKHKSWTGAFTLDSGEQTNFAEMAIAATLSKWQAERGQDGRLMVTHPDSGKRVPFSASMLKEFAKIRPQTTLEGQKLSFDGNPLKFADEYLPHLLAAGLLRKSDFRTLGGGEHRVHERRLNPKAPYLTFSNSSGQSAKYYFGRGKLAGTDIKINSETMSAAQLDPDTVAIINNLEGKKQVIRIFSLVSGDQMEKIRGSTATRLAERDMPVNSKNISMNTVVGDDLMSERLKEYSLADFLPPRPGEKKEQYQRRLEHTPDVMFVLETATNFFQQADLPLHGIPWSEQLVLSQVLRETNDQQELVNFAKKYGIKGLRSFLSLNQDPSLGPRILEIGSKLSPSLAKEVFGKYNAIIDSASQAQRYLAAHFEEQTPETNLIATRIKDQLLKKGKDLLRHTAETLSQEGAELEVVSLVKELEAIKTDVLLFAATFKNLPREAGVQLEQMEGTSLETKDSSQLTEFQKQQMREIFIANRIGNYPAQLNDKVNASFEKTMAEPGHTFTLLEHQGRVVAYFHYDELDKDSLYVGSLNLHPSAKDSPIAVAMVKASLENVPDKNLTALVWSKNIALKRFYNTLGFKQTGVTKNYLGSGEEYTNLLRPKPELKMELPEAA